MHMPERPSSSFYADVNDPTFAEGFFDAYCVPIERYVREHTTNTRSAAYECPEDLALRIRLAAQSHRMDHIIHYTNGISSTYEVVDNGAGLARAIADKIPVEPSHPTILQGSGIELDNFISKVFDKNMHRAYLLNAAGVALGEPGRAIMWDWLRPDLERGDAAWNLFGVRMAMVTVAELTFDERGEPDVSSARSAELHQQFGVVTTQGFAPFFTRLSGSHPAMQAYNQQLYSEATQQHATLAANQKPEQQPIPRLTRVKEVAKRLLLRYNKS